MYNEKKIKEDEINESVLDKMLPSKITFVNKLIIEYLIEEEFLFKSDETTYEKDRELYILEQNDEDDMIELISKYICDTKDLSRDSFGWIERILRKQMNREEIYNFLDNKKVIELPQKFDIDDEPSLFDANPSLSKPNNKTVYDTSTSQEENYPQESSRDKEEIAPPIKPKTTYKNMDNTTESKMKKKDIVPPIQPQTLSQSKKFKLENNLKDNREKKVTNSFKNNLLNTTSKKVISSNDRKPVYVGKDREIDTKQKNQNASAREIGNKGENYILQHTKSLLLDKSNDFYKAPPNQEGYDLTEEDSKGNIIRYIEVKTLTGEWGEGGVGITEHQFNFAQKQKDKWWLFVVEGINTDSPKVYQFKNPVTEANRFMFDNSWKQLAY